MKRGNESDPNLLNNNKRAKVSTNNTSATALDELFKDPSQLKRPLNILHNELDGNGYVHGKVIMAYPGTTHGGRLVYIINSNQTQTQKLRFDLSISAELRSEIVDLKIHDEVFVSLRGCDKQPKPVTSAPNALPLILHYEQGVAFRCIRKNESDITVDTWNTKETQEYDADDWFPTPPVVDSSSTTIVKSVIEKRHAPMEQYIKEAIGEEPIPPITRAPATVQKDETQEVRNLTPVTMLTDSTSKQQLHASTTKSLEPGNQPFRANAVVSGSSENATATDAPLEKRKKTRKERQGRDRGKAKKVVDSPTVPSMDSLEQNAKPPVVRGPPERQQVNLTVGSVAGSISMATGNTAQVPKIAGSHSPKAFSPNEPSQMNAPMPNHSTNISFSAPDMKQKPIGPLTLHAGFRCSTALYRALSSLHSLGANVIVNIIGVVNTVSSVTKTRKGELSCSVTLVDPSNTIVDQIFAPEGFRVNCFTKKYPQWLPQPVPGNVLIFHNVKLSLYNGNITGVGYSDKLQWAIYAPEKGEVHYGDQVNVPQSEGLADGYGLRFTPFFIPSEEEIRYCLQMSDWWREVLKLRKEEEGKANYIGEVVSKPPGRITRQHRLVQDAGPNIAPDGYFDCTVQVLHGWQNDNGVYTLYVTDYTKNAEISSTHSGWCLPALSDYVLKMEMWDDASKMGLNMRTGEYYHINNARMVRSKGGYMEAKVTQTKIRQLQDDDTDDMHLTALLERKKALGLQDIASSFEHRLIKDIEDNKFFDCTVEILHTVPATANKAAFIYVTDYTSHPNLFATQLQEAWARRLEGHVAKIVLMDAQSTMAESVKIGSYYSIKKLRLKRSTTGNQFQGFLGGNEPLIRMLNATNKENQHLADLLKRKEEWQKDPSRPQIANPAPLIPVYKPEVTSIHDKRRIHTSIKDVKENISCPEKFRIIARIVNLFPTHHPESAVAFCTNCKNHLPKHQAACYDCNDWEHAYVQYQYQLFLHVEDEHQDPLLISISDDCKFFDGLKRVNFDRDSSAYGDFCRRIEPLVRKRSTEDGLLSLIVHSWPTPDGKRAYGLTSLES
ncbi:hypothetical protein BDQ12DRAFT_676116 [Crucibulum laeve]|uniref:Protection of telomeres protein 1 n=1 Tax=Crucibulum laeve TaxID=68775 RepID=A0A5C3MCJ5_9AGAR|nr:hypothetical protein BDQ12DRAFT_676116 [Crucibulum laeve]